MEYEYVVFIGRFQPVHKSHLQVMQEALTHGKKLIVVLGSANAAENIKNPWSVAEREEMIRVCFGQDQNERIIVTSVGDHFYNDNEWITEVQQRVYEESSGSDSVALIGTYKDESSYYIKLFPQWDEIVARSHDMMNATDVRTALFSEPVAEGVLENCLPQQVNEWLAANYEGSDRHQNMKDEFKFINDYKTKWASAPFVPTFNTVDAVVIQSGHILVVKRKFHPGKGLWALPGGFLKPTETLATAAIRELKEETGIRVDKAELKRHIVSERTFDHPSRSLRGRTITHAYCIHLPNGPLPEVRGSDDAAAAKWIPLMDVPRLSNKFYEDHSFIVEFFIRKF